MTITEQQVATQCSVRIVPVPGAFTVAICYHRSQTAIGLSVLADDEARYDTA